MEPEEPPLPPVVLPLPPPVVELVPEPPELAPVPDEPVVPEVPVETRVQGWPVPVTPLFAAGSVPEIHQLATYVTPFSVTSCPVV